MLFVSPFASLEYGAGPVIIDGEYRFRIHEVRRVDGFDYQYDLRTDHPQERLLLDCQSFIQNLKVLWTEEGQEEELVDGMLLSPGECQFIAYNVFTIRSQGQDICLKIIPEDFSIKIGDDPEGCYEDGLEPRQ